MAAPDFIPDYLKPFVAKQDASLYTPIDHASWRFILRVSRDFFSQNAHEKYLSGLAETGISTERIPLVSEMDEKLKRFGWRAVAVSGFIPPAVFMEFQSLGILPIACEMRTLEHLAYTPAPDIVHEAAGHAPIIADPEYAAYLRAYGEISRKAIFSSQDMEVYEAVRNLSIVKEDPKSSPSDIDQAQARLDAAGEAVTYLSEATLMARMNWWTVEYGLVGSLDNPKIYGAGLLSSMGESYHCLGSKVKKLPLTLECVDTAYDITKPQPQLFVTPDFQHLTKVLHEFAETMAFRTGGKAALEKAIQAKTVCTAELDSGIQISGVIDAYRSDTDGSVIYLHANGPTQLAFKDSELPNQGPDYHREGFSTVIGSLRGLGKSPSELSDAELRSLEKGGRTLLEFSSGIRVDGKLGEPVRDLESNRVLILPFSDCTVTAPDGSFLFKPEWGTFDLACGSHVVSVFGGAADRKNYLLKTGGFEQSPMTPKYNLTPENRELNTLYAKTRELRESEARGEVLIGKTIEIAEALDARTEPAYEQDWLLRLELLELLWNAKATGETHSAESQEEIRKLDTIQRLETRLHEIRKISSDREDMIQRGLSVLRKERGESK
jgi:phenylalanine-4-hydroxylase